MNGTSSSNANNTHFQKKGFTLSIILYVKLFMRLDKELLHEFGYYVAKGN